MTTLYALTALWALFIVVVAASTYDRDTVLLGLIAVGILLAFGRRRA